MMKVKDVMTPKVVTVAKGEPIRTAWLLMEKHNFHHLPIVDGNKLVGMLSDKDLYKALPSIEEIKDHAKLARILDTVKVDEVMTPKVKAVGPDMDVRQAARLFVENRFGCFPVVLEGKLVGILTTTDLLRYIVEDSIDMDEIVR